MDCREKIVSEEYADFFTALSPVDQEITGSGTDECLWFSALGTGVVYRKLSSQTGVLPPEILVMDGKKLIDYQYAEIPKLFALMDTAAIEETGAIRLQNYPGLELGGRGVIIGFVGDGIDVYHEAFRFSDGTTRLAGAWDQTSQELEPPFDLKYGSYLSREKINEELQNNNSPVLSGLAFGSEHTTFMAGIAAGNIGVENGFSSAAPLADLAVVKLKPAKTYLKRYYYVDDTAEVYQENDILTGVIFLIRLAVLLKQPIIICVATGTSFGAHNGLSVIGELLNIIADRPGTGICVASGNEGNSRHHFMDRLTEEGRYENVEIRVEEGLSGLSIEMWGESPDLYSIEIISPTGERIPRFTTGISGSNSYEFLFQETRIFVKYEIVENRSGAQVIEIKLDVPAPGIWTIRVFGDLIRNGEFHLWLPITEILGEDTYFLRPDPYTTLTIPSDASLPVTVGAYDDETGGIFVDSGRGNPVGRLGKPTLVAPGVNVYGPDVGNRYIGRSGTSVSTAITAGLMAQLMEWGVLRGKSIYMSTTQIKSYLIRGANRRPALVYPDREWGYGIVDVYNSLDILRN